MATKREFLVGLGLAKEGRGKFSAAAHAALEEAIASGVTFDEPVVTAKPKAPKPATNAAPKPPKAPKAPKVTKVTPAAPTAAAPTPLLMPKRQQTTGYAVERNTLIAYQTCGSNKVGCGKPIQFCGCSTGPVAPHYLDKNVAGKPLALTKPLV